MAVISTIGYEGTTVEFFIDLLKSSSIVQVIDVRELPLSRKKGFSKNGLGAQLEANGIKYVHIKSLGDPKAGRNAARSGRISEFRRIFHSHLSSDAAQDGLSLAVKIAKEANSALLCFEAQPHACHRNIIAEEMRMKYGFSIRHIYNEIDNHYGRARKNNCSCKGRPSGGQQAW